MISGFYVLAICSVCLASAAQLLLKHAATSSAFAAALSAGRLVEAVQLLLRQPAFLGGMTLFAVSVSAWIVVLSRIPVSQAYPLVAIGIALTALFGNVAFGEAMPPVKIAAILFIVFGVVLLSRA